MKFLRGMIDLLMAGFLLALTLLSVPKLWGFEIYTVTSGSMAPVIHTGDVIYVRQDEGQVPSVGEIVTYSLNEGKTLVTHRVTAVDTERQLVQTKGDANEEADGWIRFSSLRGTVRYSIRWLGYLGSMLAMTSGRLFFLAVFLWMAAAQLVISHILQLRGPEDREGEDGCTVLHGLERVQEYRRTTAIEPASAWSPLRFLRSLPGGKERVK